MKGAKNTVDLNALKTIKNFAIGEGVTAAYIYKLITNNIMDCYTIDGVQFININDYPTIPASVKRRNR